MPARAAIVGASGYTGLELVRLLLAHPAIELGGVFASAGGQSVGRPMHELWPQLRGLCDQTVREADADAIARDAPDVVFLATPHEASAALAPALVGRVGVVADLSGAFRLPDAGLYPRHYGFVHPAPELLGRAVYGLVERDPPGLAEAGLIACPGCYPTASLLALTPLVGAGLLEPGRPVRIDAVSGVSGAGRGAQRQTLFGEVSLRPYAVLTHRHQPEIACHGGASVLFTPTVAPFFRGLVSILHADLAPGVDSEDVGRALADAYASRAFVRLLGRDGWPSVGAVERTNFADIGWTVAAGGGHAVVACAIDNLLKGAAGQAVQAVNVRLGLGEAAGLAPCVSAAGGG